jgi:phage/plasmid-like protein (TIGR03299 family)
MAHAIDMSTGKAAMISLKEKPWHGLGVIQEDAISAEDALNKGGLNWEVIKAPNTHHIFTPTGELIRTDISETSFFTYRADTYGVLGDRLGKDYTVMQNTAALNIVDEVLQSGRATIETAGALDEGRRVFICLKAGDGLKVSDGDIVQPYILVATSHDGSMSITAKATNIRVVCQNTLSAALRSEGVQIAKIRHTTNAEGRLREALKIVKMIDRTPEELEYMQRMQEQELSRAQLSLYLANVFLSAEELKEVSQGTRIEKVASQRKLNMIAEAMWHHSKAPGQDVAMKNGNPTMWSAYNAVTAYASHRKYSDVNDRANSLLFGTSANLIEVAHEVAMNPERLRVIANGANFNLN